MDSPAGSPLSLFLPAPTNAGAEAVPAAYRIAEHRVECSRSLPGLAAFRATCGSEAPSLEIRPGAPAPIPPGPESCIYRGAAWIGREWRRVECRRSAEGYSLTIDGLGLVRVAADGAGACVEPTRAVAESFLEEAALGPGLILSLALRGVFSFHASSVLGPARQLLAFAGPSGAGKSTLARMLDAHAGWARAADDILPVTSTPEGPEALPRFPQLKLAPDAQPGAALPERVPLAALFVLAPRRSDPGIGLRRLGTREGALALVRHTAAARLFDRDLLARHLEACVRLAGDVPVAELSFPWTGEVPAELVKILSAAGSEAA